MPPFQSDTGNKTWDQNISTLGQALFPDPSKAGQAYYYGAAARKNLLESNKLNDELNARNRFGMMGLGGPQPAPPTYIQPSFPEGAAPYLGPPSNLPIAGQPAAPAAPAASLAATVSSMTPGRAADLVEPAVQAQTVGTPAPYGPPSAVSPPAPQTTTSAGTVPTQDIGSGNLHPQSLNNQAGTQASPATASGSPSPVPPGMTLPGIFAYTNAGALAGIPAATLNAGGQALAYTMFERGLINQTQLMQMLGSTGQAGPWQQTIQSDAARYGHDKSAAAQVQSANIQAGASRYGHDAQAGATRYGHDARAGTDAARLTEDRRQFEATVKPTVDETGKVVYTPQSQLPGQQYYEPSVAATVAGERQRQAGLTSTYMHPTIPGRTVEALRSEAIAQGLQPAPTTLEGAQAPISTAIFGAQTPEEAAPLIARRDRAVPPPKKPEAEKAKEEVTQQWMLNRQLGATIPPEPVTSGPFGVFGTASNQSGAAPAGAGPALGPVLTKLANDYYQSGPPGVKGEWTAASNAAIQQGIQEGWIRPDQPKTTPIILPTGENSTPTQHFQIDLYDPADKGKPIQEAKPLALGSNFTPAMKGASIGATMAPGAKPPAPGTVIRPAPGIPEGELGNGGKYIVRGGNWVVK